MILHVKKNIAIQLANQNWNPPSGLNKLLENHDSNHTKLFDETIPPEQDANDDCPDENKLPHLSSQPYPASSDDEDQDLLTVLVNHKRSYFQQRKTANQTIMASAEQQNFLPWTWTQPNPQELKSLYAWIDQTARVNTESEQILSLISWIAIKTGRSLWRAQQIPIDSEISSEWTLFGKEGCLRRIPPHRHNAWLPILKEEQEWVYQTDNFNQITIPPVYQKILVNRLNVVSAVKKIEDLWDANWADSAKTAFYKNRPAALARITPGKLAGILPQQVYQEAGDGVLSRMIASHPESGLPGAFAYGSWSNETVDGYLNGNKVQPITEKAFVIGAGSRLQAIESLLQKSITNATERLVNAYSEGDWITQHNLYTSYLTVAYLAATGGRPIRDPLETLSTIDSDQKFAYADDKTREETHRGRLIPLHEDLVHHLLLTYCKYLKQLSWQLEQYHPLMASHVMDIAHRKNNKMPALFFLYSDKKTLDWRSVTESGIRDLHLFDWPLPLRLFRHRLSQRLRNKTGLNFEIIDGLLGHAEAGGHSYGPYSARCWNVDMKDARPCLSSSWACLNFKLIPPKLNKTISIDTSIEKTSIRTWGSELRKKNRLTNARNAVIAAEQTILEFLSIHYPEENWRANENNKKEKISLRNLRNKKLSELSADQVDALVHQLFFNFDNTPLSNGHLRYRHFEKLLDKLWLRQGLKVSIKRRFPGFSIEQSPFHPEAIGALNRYIELKKLWHGFVKDIIPSRQGVKTNLFMGILFLCIDHRITSTKIINEILSNNHYRLIRWLGKYYLEYSPSLTKENKNRDIPCHRFEINQKIAAFFDQALDGDSNALNLPIGSKIADVFNQWDNEINISASISATKLFNIILLTTRQYNAMMDPSLVAAYRNGAFPSASPSWKDMARLSGKSPIIIPDENSQHPLLTSNMETLIQSFVDSPLKGKKILSDEEQLQLSAKKFLKEISGAISKIVKSELKDKRGAAKNAVRRILKDREGTISNSIAFLGSWAEYLISTKSEKTGHYLSLKNTVNNYLGKLANRFSDVAYETNILSLDTEEITELYTDIIDHHKIDDQQSVIDRLHQFHSWARQYGVDEPDWNDIPGADFSWAVAPRIITEEEYQAALCLLTYNAAEHHDFVMAASMLLILCYRFGLRPSEALGLAIQDFIQNDDGTVILVRKTPYRTLKNPQSRRQVPLLFKLTKQEKKVIDYTVTNALAKHGTDIIAPLFSEAATHRSITDADALKQTVNSVLKKITGNTNTVLYDCRHSCANRVALTLYRLELKSWKRLRSTPPKKSPEFDIESILLGHTTKLLSRRIGWAIARFFGHGHPGTAHRSYIHFLADWAQSTTTLPDITSRAKLNNFIDLDSFKKAPAINSSIKVTLNISEHTQITPLLAFKVLILMSYGLDAEYAAVKLNLAPHWANYFSKEIAHVNRQLAGQDSVDNWILQRLSKTTIDKLQNYISICQKQSAVPGLINGIDYWSVMISKQQQILLWKKEHFELFKLFVDFFKIPSADYDVVFAPERKNQLITYATNTGIHPLPPNDLEKYQTRIHVDIAWDSPDKIRRIEHRCAVILHPQNSSIFETKSHIITLFMAFSSALISVQ